MDILALALSIIGCLNWGLVGLFQFDLVAWLFGSASTLSRIIYVVIGVVVAAVVVLVIVKAASKKKTKE